MSTAFLLLLLGDHNLRLHVAWQRLQHLDLRLLHFSSSLLGQLIQQSLVADVQPGRGKDGDPGEDRKGEQVEASSYVGHHVQTQAKFQGVHLGKKSRVRSRES